MAFTARVLRCQLRSPRSAVQPREAEFGPVQLSVRKPKTKVEYEGTTNVVLQPRLSNLRAYGSDRTGVMRSSSRNDGEDGVDDVSPFFATLSDYIESYKKSRDFETISGRLAMVCKY